MELVYTIMVLSTMAFRRPGCFVHDDNNNNLYTSNLGKFLYMCTHVMFLFQIRDCNVQFTCHTI